MASGHPHVYIEHGPTSVNPALLIKGQKLNNLVKSVNLRDTGLRDEDDDAVRVLLF